MYRFCTLKIFKKAPVTKSYNYNSNPFTCIEKESFFIDHTLNASKLIYRTVLAYRPELLTWVDNDDRQVYTTWRMPSNIYDVIADHTGPPLASPRRAISRVVNDRMRMRARELRCIFFSFFLTFCVLNRLFLVQWLQCVQNYSDTALWRHVFRKHLCFGHVMKKRCLPVSDSCLFSKRLCKKSDSFC